MNATRKTVDDLAMLIAGDIGGTTTELATHSVEAGPHFHSTFRTMVKLGGPLPTSWQAVMRWHQPARHEQADYVVFSSIYLGRKCFLFCEYLQGKWHLPCSNPIVNRAAGCEATVVAAIESGSTALQSTR